MALSFDNKEQILVWDSITLRIENCRQDGINYSGEFSAELKTQQRKYIDGLRIARLTAFKALSAA